MFLLKSQISFPLETIFTYFDHHFISNLRLRFENQQCIYFDENNKIILYLSYLLGSLRFGVTTDIQHVRITFLM
jgi:hypothetical protein